MSRRIVTREYHGTNAAQPTVDTYFDRLLKYIPSDVIGLWLVGSGLIETLNIGVDRYVTFVAFFVACVLVTIWWTNRQTREIGKPTARTQITISTVAFMIWVLAIKGAGIKAVTGWYQPIWGSLILLVYTVVIGKVVPTKDDQHTVPDNTQVV